MFEKNNTLDVILDCSTNGNYRLKKGREFFLVNIIKRKESKPVRPILQYEVIKLHKEIL